MSNLLATERTLRKMVRVGVVGLGHMGLLHLRNMRFLRDVEVVAAADKSKKRLREAKGYGVRNRYQDYTDLLECPDLEAVVISLPNFLHRDSIVRSAEEGLHIFVEKPLARNVSECEEIKDAVKRHNVKLGVGHNYRLFPNVQKLKSAFERGTIGDVEQASFEYFANGPFTHPLEPVPIQDWWLDRELCGGGVLLDQGYHLIYLFRWFFSDAEVIYAFLGHRYGLQVEDSATLVLRSKRFSTTGIVSVGWFEKLLFPTLDFRINLHGTFGFLSSDSFTPKNLYLHAAKEVAKNILRRIGRRRIKPLSYTYYYASYFEELERFFASVANERDPDVGVDDAIETVKIIEAAYDLVNRK